MVNCRTQKEIDYCWKKLSAGGKEVQCGWLKDKFGLFWQITPTNWDEFYTGDAKSAERVMRAMSKMVKLDIAKLKKAYKGKE
jgi:predicted 3-demethylubiquinone-9 3-methyltransferase (glyoxalase superfamily)